jgi:drug/metabolite transporter (DMT)-like permease
MPALIGSHFGELAALAAALAWAVSAILFHKAGVSVHPILLNLYKGTLASLLLAIWLIVDAADRAWLDWPSIGILLASGAIGIGLGDTAFFAALNRIGERRTVLIAETTAPPLTAILAMLWLAELLSARAVTGIVVTIAGVAWVISERPQESSSAGKSSEAAATPSSLGLALLAALCQAVGAVLSRQVLTETDASASLTSLLRLLGGLTLLLLWLPWAGRSIYQPMVGRGRVLTLIVMATLIGTVFGIVCQQTALRYAGTAVVQTLLATSALFVLPLLAAQGQRISARAICGALVALLGVALLLLT